MDKCCLLYQFIFRIICDETKENKETISTELGSVFWKIDSSLCWTRKWARRLNCTWCQVKGEPNVAHFLSTFCRIKKRLMHCFGSIIDCHSSELCLLSRMWAFVSFLGYNLQEQYGYSIKIYSIFSWLFHFQFCCRHVMQATTTSKRFLIEFGRNIPIHRLTNGQRKNSSSAISGCRQTS